MSAVAGPRGLLERSPASGWRRHRGAIVIGAAVVVALAAAALASRPTGTSADLDPENAAPNGARALARVLADRGVDVVLARDADALEDRPVGPGTLVVVTSADDLGTSTTARLLDHVGSAPLVVVEPGPGASRGLQQDLSPATVRPDAPVAAGCSDPQLSDLRLEVDRARAYTGPGCFATGDGVLLATPRPGLTLLGAGAALSNEQVLRGDNAAAALRLLGGQQRLVWYVPDLADLGAEDGVGIETLLPRWLRPALLLVMLGAIALVGWRVRRLGPLAVEPLPVVVRSLETTRSRGRLYRRAGDRTHAAEALRRATRRRLADRLGLASPSPEVLVARLAAHLGRPEAPLAALVGPEHPTPATDEDLTDLAAALAALEEEVRHP